MPQTIMIWSIYLHLSAAESNRLNSTRVRPGRIGATPEITARNLEEEDELSGDRAVTKVEARNVVADRRCWTTSADRERRLPVRLPHGPASGQLRAASGPETEARIGAVLSKLVNQIWPARLGNLSKLLRHLSAADIADKFPFKVASSRWSRQICSSGDT